MDECEVDRLIGAIQRASVDVRKELREGLEKTARELRWSLGAKTGVAEEPCDSPEEDSNVSRALEHVVHALEGVIANVHPGSPVYKEIKWLLQDIHVYTTESPRLLKARETWAAQEAALRDAQDRLDVAYRGIRSLRVSLARANKKWKDAVRTRDQVRQELVETREILAACKKELMEKTNMTPLHVFINPTVCSNEYVVHADHAPGFPGSGCPSVHLRAIFPTVVEAIDWCRACGFVYTRGMVPQCV